MKLRYFGMNFFFVLAKAFAVVDGVEHQQKPNHQSGNDAGEKQVAHGSTGGHTVHDKRNARRNDNAGGLI